MAVSITNYLRDTILTELQTDLPAKLSALSLPPINGWYNAKRAIPPAEFLPCVMVSTTNWRQNVGDFDAGADGPGLRVYSYYIWAAVLGSTEEESEERASGLADAIDAVLSSNTFGVTKVFDTWCSGAEISVGASVASGQLKAVRLTCSVKYHLSTGDYSA